jgi:hypothetical protein
MDITVITKHGDQDEYVSGQDAISKNETLDAISRKYTNDNIDRIEVKYDNIDVATLGGGRATASGAMVSVNTIEELKAELGGYTG